MNEFASKLTDELLTAFASLVRLEELLIAGTDEIDLSVSEIRLLKCVGSGFKSISEIADSINITMPSVTVAVKKLEKKGCVEKFKSKEDKRMVFVRLTTQGQKIAVVYQYFHENMARSFSKDFTQAEKEAFISGIQKLNLFFDTKIQNLEETK